METLNKLPKEPEEPSDQRGKDSATLERKYVNHFQIIKGRIGGPYLVGEIISKSIAPSKPGSRKGKPSKSG